MNIKILIRPSLFLLFYIFHSIKAQQSFILQESNENVFAQSNFHSNTIVFDRESTTEPNNSVNLTTRGLYFYKKTYVPTPIPTYSSSKANLPALVLDGNPGYVNMYNKAWELAFSHIKAPAAGSALVSNFYDEAFDGSIYQWDMLFMTMFGRYADHIFDGVASLDNFYANQNKSGSISRMISESTGEDAFPENSSNLINPPLFAWAELENYKITGNTTRLSQVLLSLEKYAAFVDSARGGYDTNHKLFWSNGQASGMDNTPRDNGRSGGHYASDHQGWVDMSSHMVIQYNAISEICRILGKTDSATIYANKALSIANNINKWCWNNTDGLYYDVDVNSTQTNWKTAASFIPMLAGITTPAKDTLMIRNLKDTLSFWRAIVFPTLAADEPGYESAGGYWLGGVWAPTNYQIIKGLERTGNNAFAKIATERYINGLYQVYLNTGTLWENYAPDCRILRN